ncbi:MAG: hypothetical protein JST16_12475 [Bdellovibrionales bacterium]|nr:hypothetical protein [Bdellovibrionales bacterium]
MPVLSRLSVSLVGVSLGWAALAGQVLHGQIVQMEDLSPPRDASIEYYPALESLPEAYNRRPISEVVEALRFTPNTAAFASLAMSRNEGITFQGGVANPKLDYRVPFCTIKFARDLTNRTHYLSNEELVAKTATSVFESTKVERTDARKVGGSISTTIFINRPNQPQASYVVELVQCMIDSNGQTFYRELTMNELKTVFGKYIKISVKLK